MNPVDDFARYAAACQAVGRGGISAERVHELASGEDGIGLAALQADVAALTSAAADAQAALSAQRTGLETCAMRASMAPEAVVRGKKVWEVNQCIGCHSLLGEGAYFAPELGNVYKRRGGDESGAAFIKAWMKAQPTGAPGRRQMPQFHLSEQQLDDLVEFLKWTGGINAEQWPPNIEG